MHSQKLAVKKFFSREPPAEYLEEWRQALETVPEENNPDEMSVLIFKLANEWFSLAAESLTEVTPLRRIHTIPHRTSPISWKGDTVVPLDPQYFRPC